MHTRPSRKGLAQQVVRLLASSDGTSLDSTKRFPNFLTLSINRSCKERLKENSQSDKSRRDLKSLDRSDSNFSFHVRVCEQTRIRSDSKPIATTNESPTAITRTFFSRSFGLPALIEWNGSRSDSRLT